MDQAKISRKRRWVSYVIMILGWLVMWLGGEMEGKIKGIWDWDYFVFIGFVVLIIGLLWEPLANAFQKLRESRES